MSSPSPDLEKYFNSPTNLFRTYNYRSRSPNKTRKKSPDLEKYFNSPTNLFRTYNYRSRSPNKTRKKSVTPKKSKSFGKYYLGSIFAKSAKTKKAKEDRLKRLKSYIETTRNARPSYNQDMLPESMSANRVKKEQEQRRLEEYVESVPAMRKVYEAIQSGQEEGRLKNLDYRLNKVRSGTGKGIRRQRRSRRKYRRKYRRKSRRR